MCKICKVVRHIARACPKRVGKLNALEIAKGTSPGKGKKPTILEGTLLFKNLTTRVLFDTSASHSFVSKGLVDRLDMGVIYLVTSLRITNTVGGFATLMMLCKNV